MAVADWTFSTINGTGAHNAEPYGITIPAPDAESGSYARVITMSSTAVSGFTPSDPAFVGVPTTKAIRVQCCWYLPNTSVVIRLGVKSTPSVNVSGWTDGYSVTNINNQLYFYAPGGFQVLLENQGSSTWHSMRITVYPLLANIDRVIVEKETFPGSDVWTSTFGLASGDITIDGNVFPARYAPWGGSTLNGIWAQGYGAQTYFIDKLQVKLADVPVPIP